MCLPFFLLSPSVCLSTLLSVSLSFCSYLLLSIHFDHKAKTLPGHPKHQVSITSVCLYICLFCVSAFLFVISFCLYVHLCLSTPLSVSPSFCSYLHLSVHFDHETKTLPGHPKHQVIITNFSKSVFVCLYFCLFILLSILPVLALFSTSVRPLRSQSQNPAQTSQTSG